MVKFFLANLLVCYRKENATKPSKQQRTGSHPEMVDDMSRVTLNFDQSKIPFVHF